MRPAIIKSTLPYPHLFPWQQICSASCTNWWLISTNATLFTHTKIKSECVLQHMTIFLVGLPSWNWSYRNTTCLCCTLMTTTWQQKQSKPACYMLKSTVGKCYSTWDILLPYFLKFPCICPCQITRTQDKIIIQRQVIILWKCGIVQTLWNNNSKSKPYSWRKEANRLNSRNACYHQIKHLSTHLVYKNVNIKTCENEILPVVLYWSHISYFKLHGTSTDNIKRYTWLTIYTCCPRWVKTGADTLGAVATRGGCRMILVTRLITGSLTEAGSSCITGIAGRTCESEIVAVFSSVLVGSLVWTSAEKHMFTLIIRTDTVVWLCYFAINSLNLWSVSIT
jgi:hypothetical protein